MNKKISLLWKRYSTGRAAKEGHKVRLGRKKLRDLRVLRGRQILPKDIGEDRIIDDSPRGITLQVRH